MYQKNLLILYLFQKQEHNNHLEKRGHEIGLPRKVYCQIDQEKFQELLTNDQLHLWDQNKMWKKLVDLNCHYQMDQELQSKQNYIHLQRNEDLIHHYLQ